jgi:subtilisin family serine protease
MDVSAPGQVVITTYNPNSYWATFRFNLVPSAAGLYGTAGAVSGANPIVAGIVALMLDLDPTLDAAQIKQILRDTAQADAFTGAVPNTRWGGGKVNALAALDRVHDNLSRMSVNSPDSSTLRITARGQSGKQYFLEKTTDFLAWERVATNLATANPFHFDVPIGITNAFYRLAR